MTLLSGEAWFDAAEWWLTPCPECPHGLAGLVFPDEQEYELDFVELGLEAAGYLLDENGRFDRDLQHELDVALRRAR